MIQKLLIAILFLMLSASSVVAAVVASVDVDGRIIDQSNNPVINASVTFYDKTDKAVQSVTTDTAGIYQTSVPQGLYTITAAGPNGAEFEPVTFANREIASSQTIDFTLTQAQSAALDQENSNNQLMLPIVMFALMLIGVAVGVIVYLRIWKKKKLPQSGGSD